MNEIIEKLRALIEEPGEVLKVLELVPEPGTDRFLYLIETCLNFPRYAMGSTDAEFLDVRIRLSCGEEWNAREKWGRLVLGEPLHQEAA